MLTVESNVKVIELWLEFYVLPNTFTPTSLNRGQQDGIYSLVSYDSLGKSLDYKRSQCSIKVAMVIEKSNVWRQEILQFYQSVTRYMPKARQLIKISFQIYTYKSNVKKHIMSTFMRNNCMEWNLLTKHWQTIDRGLNFINSPYKISDINSVQYNKGNHFSWFGYTMHSVQRYGGQRKKTSKWF